MTTENGLITRISKFLRKDNNLQLAIAGVAAVALIAFVWTTMSSFGGQKPAEEDVSTGTLAAADSTTDLADRLEHILSQVRGAGEVDVFVTYETGPEIVPAFKTDTQSNSSGSDGTGQNNHTTSTTENREPVVVQGKNGTEPLVLVEKEPVVLAVLVVAEGASDMDVRIMLMQAVQVALQVAPARIEVLPMNISNSKEGK